MSSMTPGTGDSRDFVHGVLDVLIDDLNRPAFRAGLTAAMLTAAVLARLGARALPAVVVSAMTGAAVEHLYGLGEDAVSCLRAMRTRPEVTEAEAFPHDIPRAPRRRATREV